ncbi:unnamed protein product [Caenorhabditis bovis]|uniref:Uncharacterized protein n=1 Tax=Caenorhabditis bovis TaxID=2654633 RepID=A0A8S1FEI4_9PELO|nr:unnamed protein product [Caenorhabditis bovis]
MEKKLIVRMATDSYDEMFNCNQLYEEVIGCQIRILKAKLEWLTTDPLKVACDASTIDEINEPIKGIMQIVSELIRSGNEERKQDKLRALNDSVTALEDDITSIFYHDFL